MKLVLPVGKDISTFLTEANAGACGCYCDQRPHNTFAASAHSAGGCCCDCGETNFWSTALNFAGNNRRD